MLFDVLWAEVSSEFKLLSINFAEHTSKTAVKPEKLDYPLDSADVEAARLWVDLLLKKAYGGLFILVITISAGVFVAKKK